VETYTPRFVTDDREKQRLSSLVRTFLAIPGAFSFWKEVKTNLFNPDGGTWEEESNMKTKILLPAMFLTANAIAFAFGNEPQNPRS
jgi:hypothetical protein